MKHSQLCILSGNIFLAGSLLTTHLTSSVFLGFMFCTWFLMGIYHMRRGN